MGREDDLEEVGRLLGVNKKPIFALFDTFQGISAMRSKLTPEGLWAIRGPILTRAPRYNALLRRPKMAWIGLTGHKLLSNSDEPLKM